MPMPTEDNLRGDFPEFGDQAAYPPEQIKFWLDIAGLLLTDRWDDSCTGRNTDNAKTMLYVGAELFAAHHMAISGRDYKAAQNGGAPGIASSTGVGAVSAKAVGDGSVSYDVQATIVINAGHWNLTTYGTRFIQMAKIVGSGGMQVGVGCTINPFIPVPGGTPWFGPIIDQGWGWD